MKKLNLRLPGDDLRSNSSLYDNFKHLPAQLSVLELEVAIKQNETDNRVNKSTCL